MQCPSCRCPHSKMRQMRGGKQTRDASRVKRTRICTGCGRVYQTVEISREVFEKALELARARRDLDSLLLDYLVSGTLQDDA